MEQILRDSMGKVIGKIKTVGNKEIIYDFYGRQLGYFDGKYTYDFYGKRIGQGNLLTALLRNF